MMLAKTDVAKVYETVLSSPGMDEVVKLNLQIPRRNVLLLNKVIERGVAVREGDEKMLTVLDVASKETVQELLAIGGEILEKAGLTKMNEKLNAF